MGCRMKNAVDRMVPEFIEGYGKVRPFLGAYCHEKQPKVKGKCQIHTITTESKVVDSIEQVIKKIGIKDGMTISFHHHLRNGDKVAVKVMEAIRHMGLKDIHVAASGIFACHDALAPMLDDRTITKVSVSTFGPGEVAKAISYGRMKYPAVMYTHGGRARAIEAGDLHINVAFVAAPSCDEYGNLNGSQGKSACGCLSYCYADVVYADYVIAVTDNLVSYPCYPAEITENYVDYVVEVDSIGDPGGIVSGAMRVTTNETQLRIAQQTVDLLDKAGYIKNGMSFQAGIGGISLATSEKMKDAMLRKGVVGTFVSGGISKYNVEMLEENLFRCLWDVQCFDLEAVNNLRIDDRHRIMSASLYGNPQTKSCIVDHLDIVLLGALEIDIDFNLNVTTGSDGVIRSASGGNSDTAAGSKVSIVVSSLIKKGNRCLIRKVVTTVTTPRETVDVIVTDKGIAINPIRKDLIACLGDSGLPIVPIERLYQIGQEAGVIEDNPKTGKKIVGIVEYRDGSVIDVVRQVLD